MGIIRNNFEQFDATSSQVLPGGKVSSNLPLRQLRLHGGASSSTARVARSAADVCASADLWSTWRAQWKLWIQNHQGYVIYSFLILLKLMVLLVWLILLLLKIRLHLNIWFLTFMEFSMHIEAQWGRNLLIYLSRFLMNEDIWWIYWLLASNPGKPNDRSWSTCDLLKHHPKSSIHGVLRILDLCFMITLRQRQNAQRTGPNSQHTASLELVPVSVCQWPVKCIIPCPQPIPKYFKICFASGKINITCALPAYCSIMSQTHWFSSDFPTIFHIFAHFSADFQWFCCWARLTRCVSRVFRDRASSPRHGRGGVSSQAMAVAQMWIDWMDHIRSIYIHVCVYEECVYIYIYLSISMYIYVCIYTTIYIYTQLYDAHA